MTQTRADVAENHAQNHGKPSYIVRLPFWTDADFTNSGILHIGTTYEVERNPQITHNNNLQPALILRLENYLQVSSNFGPTNTNRYHGSHMAEELAALLSLSLCCRMACGLMDDMDLVYPSQQASTPATFVTASPPLITQTARSHPIAPNGIGKRDLTDPVTWQRMTQLTHLAADDSLILVKAARMFQQALWNVETSPQLSWLHLVTAVEVVANHWHKSRQSPVTDFQTAFPEMVPLIAPTLLKQVAEHFAYLTRSTNKFIKFLRHHQPAPPHPSPASNGLPWKSNGKMTKVYNKVYEWRSKALHEGTPFPPAMCTAPFPLGQTPPAEVPISQSAGQGGQWSLADTPILLNAFLYIVHRAITRWWDDLLQQQAQSSAGGGII